MKQPILQDQSNLSAKLVLAVGLVILAASTRLMPHPANFAGIAAVALFGGALLPRAWALTLPLASMIVSDLIIGLHPLIFFTWGTFAAIAFLSSKYLRKVTAFSVVGASVGASLLFYLVTNFAVWLQGDMYPMTLQGLMHCYYMAIPFFRGTLFGDLVYSGLLFGTYALAYRYSFPGQKAFSGKLQKTA